jgi:ABC-type multidrug transport system fused ATPase/permease subunit
VWRPRWNNTYIHISDATNATAHPSFLKKKKKINIYPPSLPPSLPRSRVQEKAFFDDPEGGAHRTGELAAVIEGDVEQAAEVFTTKLADGLRSTSSALNGTAMLLRLSPKLTGVVLGLVPAFTAAIAANVLLTRKLTARQRELQGAASGFAQERLGNLTTVRAFTAEERDEAAYALLLDEAHALAGRVSLAKGCFMGGLFFAGSATMTAVLYWGGSLAGRGEMTGGDLTSFSMYTGLVALGFSGLSSYASDTWRSAVAAGRVFDLLDRVPHPPAGPGPEGGAGGSKAVVVVDGGEKEVKEEKKRPAGRAKGHIR